MDFMEMAFNGSKVLHVSPVQVCLSTNCFSGQLQRGGTSLGSEHRPGASCTA